MSVFLPWVTFVAFPSNQLVAPLISLTSIYAYIVFLQEETIKLLDSFVGGV
jgi:hypothetical protein